MLKDLAFCPPVIAHRGARWRAPENTLVAFQTACDEGAAWIETDVKLTHDGVAILMHDDTLDRTTTGRGAVADATWESVSKLHAHNGDQDNLYAVPVRVPRLRDALHFALEHAVRLNLEIKPCPGRTQATTMVALIEITKMWPMDHPPPLISSFDHEALTMAAQLHPDWPRGLLLDGWRDDWREIVAKTQADSINMNADLLTWDRVSMLRGSGLPVLAYTVNDPFRAQELLRWGVSAVFSDNPGAVIKALQGSRSA